MTEPTTPEDLKPDFVMVPEPVGWQYRRPQPYIDANPSASEWVFALLPTERDAQLASYGGWEGNPDNTVRPLYAAPPTPSTEALSVENERLRERERVLQAALFKGGGKPLDAGISNDHAWAIGELCRKAADDKNVGDYIDRGLILLRVLREEGYELRFVGRALLPNGGSDEG